jgi:hypothetical protein
MPSGEDLCRLDQVTALPANSANVYCTNQDGTDFPYFPRDYTVPGQPTSLAREQNGALQPGLAGHSDGGIHRGDARVMISFDYAVTGNLLVGGRLGLNLFKYPGQAAYSDGRAWNVLSGRPYFDARGTWLFGQDAVAKPFAPLVFAGVGLSSFDVRTDAGITLSNGQSGTVQMWQTNGPFFLMLGGGIRVLAGEFAAINVAMRANGSFGPNGFIPSVAPEVGVAFGF